MCKSNVALSLPFPTGGHFSPFLLGTWSPTCFELIPPRHCQLWPLRHVHNIWIPLRYSISRLWNPPSSSTVSGNPSWSTDSRTCRRRGRNSIPLTFATALGNSSVYLSRCIPFISLPPVSFRTHSSLYRPCSVGHPPSPHIRHSSPAVYYSRLYFLPYPNPIGYLLLLIVLRGWISLSPL